MKRFRRFSLISSLFTLLKRVISSWPTVFFTKASCQLAFWGATLAGPAAGGGFWDFPLENWKKKFFFIKRSKGRERWGVQGGERRGGMQEGARKRGEGEVMELLKEFNHVVPFFFSLRFKGRRSCRKESRKGWERSVRFQEEEEEGNMGWLWREARNKIKIKKKINK